MEEEQRQYKLVLVGEGGAGKRTLLLHFTRGSYYPDDYDPPYELTFDRDGVVVGGESCRLDLHYVSSQELCEGTSGAWWNNHVRTADGFMLVYPINSRRAFDQLPLDRALIVQRLSRANGDDDQQGDDVTTTEPMLVVMVVGSKCDREDEREVVADEAKELARSFGGTYMETSSKAGTNVEEAFLELVRLIQHSRESTTMKKKKDMNKTCILS
jgi:GTPase KRas protein